MKTFKRIWNVVTTVIVVLVVLLAIFLLGTRLLGFRLFTILTPSMSPEYNPGDLVYVKNVPVSEVEVGDVITFVLNEDRDTATHRVVEVNSEKSHFITKGDRNESPDPVPVHFNNYLGTVKFKIPALGYLSIKIQQPPGAYIAVGVAAALILIVFLPDLIFTKKKPDNEKADQEKNTENNESQPSAEPDSEDSGK